MKSLASKIKTVVRFKKNQPKTILTNLRQRRDAMKAKFVEVKDGIKSMSTTQKVAKASRAAGVAAKGLSKFMTAKKKDGSIDASKVVGGVLDLVDSVASFLPPPISIITGKVLTYFT